MDVRNNFPFLTTNPNLAYLDNASTTQKPQPVIDAIQEYYQHGVGNIGRGNHQFARHASEQLDQTRQTIADFIHAESKYEIVFTRNTTESLNILAQALQTKLGEGDEILVTHAEHHSNLLPWMQLTKKTGCSITYIPFAEHGQLDLSNLSDLITSRTKIVSVPHISNVLGVINPVRTIVEQAKRISPEIVTIVDAAQSISHIPINVDQLTCDFLTFSGHKLYGPDGIGVLWGKRDLLENLNPFLVGGGMVNQITNNDFEAKRLPSRFEAGTPNVSGAIGLAAAVEWIQDIGFDDIQTYEHELLSHLVTELLHEFPDIRLYGYDQTLMQKNIKAPLLSFNVANIHAEEIANYVDDDGIMVRAGHHCALPLHRDVLEIDASVRVSLGIYNTKEELDRLIASLKKAKQLLA